MLRRLKKIVWSAEKQARLPLYPMMEQRVEAVSYLAEDSIEWYPPIMVSAEALGEKALKCKYVMDALELIQTLDMDDYCRYLSGYYRQGIDRFGDDWRYADIVTVLLALAETLQPKSYLEIGVRRGRSVCAVASKAPRCNMYLFDMWVANYAGMDNPGVDLVAGELDKFGHRGLREFRNGNSHQTLKTFFQEKPSLAFDIITVDGDHSYDGAAEDLCDVLPHLKIGGAIVFDDICHPKHMYLQKVWKKLVMNDPRYTSWTCKHIGYGVGFALRKW